MSSEVLRNSREAALETLPEHLSPTVEEVLREAKQRLEEIYGVRLRRVILYGSQARGDAREDSDIDVLVVLKGPLDRYEEYGRLSTVKMDLFERYRLSFSFKPFAEEAYEDMRRPLMQNIRAEGVAL